MHASIWKFTGDPDELLPRYDALLAEFPTTAMTVHLCLRADDGIVVVDTCPSEAAFRAFSTGAGFRAQLFKHGLPKPDVLDGYPVHAAIVRGETTA